MLHNRSMIAPVVVNYDFYNSGFNQDLEELKMIADVIGANRMTVDIKEQYLIH